MEELKACPFCGSKKTTIIQFEVSWGGRFAKYDYSGSCNNSDCPLEMGFELHQGRKIDAIKAWNRRTK